MKKVKIEAILEYEPAMWHGNSEEEKEWFYQDVLSQELKLHSNFIGDSIGEVTELRIVGDA